MYPGRPLRILGLLILLFSIPYAVALSTGKGIKVVWPKELVGDDDQDARPGKSVPAKSSLFFPRLRRRLGEGLLGRLLKVVALVAGGLYFSLLSAFHIGWRELSLGTWLSRIQPREYQLVATGWVRTVSGLQSIISVYLLALWVLTYFGGPFE
jgi:hypothetical protein